MGHTVSLETSVCRLLLREEDGFLTEVSFQPRTENQERSRGAEEDLPPVLSDAVRQLEEYFAGERREFSLPIRTEGTAFQKQVWDELSKIPYGETVSYGTVAARIGNPRACRAVGMAIHRNPVSIILPCHRVIGADGSLTGFGGGISVKRKLLELERKQK